MAAGPGRALPAANRNNNANRGGGTLAGAANAPRSMPRSNNGGVGLGGGRTMGRPGGFQPIGRRPASSARPPGGLSGSTLAVGQMFNNKGTRGQATVCIGCQALGKTNVLMPTLEDYYREGGEGPYCADCWADIRIPHPMYNRSGMPNCLMLYRFPERTFKQVQALVKSTIDAFTAPPPHGMARMPLPHEMDEALSNVKLSENCPFCKTDITFSPTSGDLQIKGINVP